MFTTRWQPFRLLGIPVSIDASWLIILALLTLSLASVFPVLLQDYFPGVPPNLSPYEYWIMGLVAAVVFFGCILLHELGHAVVARSQGTPIRGITLFLFGGVAEMTDEPTPRGGSSSWPLPAPSSASRWPSDSESWPPWGTAAVGRTRW